MYKLIFTFCCFLSILFAQKTFAQNEFITEWLPTHWDEIIIPTSAGQTMPGETAPYTYNYNIAWYNKRTGVQLGTANNITGNYTISSLPSDTIEVRITGTFPHFYGHLEADNLIHVKQWGNIQWKNFYYSFSSCRQLLTIPTQAPNLTQVRDMSSMFGSASAFNGDLSTWDVSNVTNMSDMFAFARAFNGDLSTWDVSNVTNMSGMFYAAYVFNSDLSTWDVSNVTNMSQMFREAPAFNSDLSTWDVSNVTNMSGMFYAAYVFNSDLSTWNVSNVTNMSAMFTATFAFNGDLSTWNVSNVTNMSYMFVGSAFNGDLSTWDVSNVTNMSSMFVSTAFNGDLSTWDVSNVTDMSSMFGSASAFNGDLSTWDVSNVTNMSRMFSGASAFNGDLSTWNVSNVTNMSEMFYSASRFNRDLSTWDISNVTNMQGMFSYSNISYCNMDNILNTWAPILLNRNHYIGSIPSASINSAIVRAVLDYRIVLQNPEVTNPTAPILSVNILTTPICIGNNVTLTATGANTYKWNNILGASTNTFTITADTTFIVKGIDANGCFATDTLEIIPLPQPIVTAISNATNNLVCFNTPITLTASGANTYEWNNIAGSSTNTFTVTKDTSIIVKGIDVNGCFATDTLDIKPVTIAVTSNTINNAACLNTSVSLTAAGAATYEWNNILGASTNTFTIAADTTFIVKGTATNGCIAFDTLTITTLALPTISTTSNALNNAACLNTSVSLTAAGANTYQWNNIAGTSTNTFTITADTTFIVKGTDANGCENTTSLQISALALPTITATSNASNNAACLNTSVSLTASGAATYEWNNIAGASTNTFTITADTTFIVKGIDANGCENTTSLQISALALPTVIATTNTTTICSGTSINLLATGANTYEWNTQETQAEITVAPTQTTTFIVKGTDTNGCIAFDTLTITTLALPTISTTSNALNNAACLNTSVSLTASGAATYEWNNIVGASTNTFTIAADTTFIVKGTDTNGCIAFDTLTITALALPTVIATSNVLNNAACLNTSVSLTASGAATYEWNNIAGASTKTFTITADTTFIVKGTAANGCSNTTSLQISALALPTVTATTNTTTICSGTSINLLATGANTYEWSTQETQAEITVAPTQNTTYTVIGTDANGCENTASLQITTLALPNVIASTNTTNDAACLNTPITLIGAGAISYFWNNRLGLSTNTFTVTADTTIILKGLDANGCENTASLQITALALPTVIATSNAINNEVCFNNPISITASGANTYEWNNILGASTNTFTITADTTIIVKGTDANACIAFDTLSINMLALPTLSITSDANDICSGTQINIWATGANTYEWNTQETLSEITVTPTQTTTYTVIGTDANGCQNTDSILITTLELPTVTLTSDATTICLGNTINLVAAGAVSFDIEVAPIETTTYTVTATAANGCENTAELEIIVNTCPSVDKIDYKYTIYPNPTNDLVTISLENIDYSNASISLIDITGRILSTTNLVDANTTISLSNYPAGLYLIKVQSGNDFFVEKVTKL